MEKKLPMMLFLFINRPRRSFASCCIWAMIQSRGFWGPATSHFLVPHPCVLKRHYQWRGAGVSFYRLTMINNEVMLRLNRWIYRYSPPRSPVKIISWDHCAADTPPPAFWCVLSPFGKHGRNVFCGRCLFIILLSFLRFVWVCWSVPQILYQQT